MKTALRAFALTALFASAAIQAQDKPVNLIVPFPPGGATDQLARVVAQKLTEKKGYVVTVENKPGAGSQVAMNAVLQAPADGNTLFLGDIGSYALNRHLYGKLNYNVERDLQPLTLLGKAPLFLMVSASSPYKTAAALIADGKTKDLPYGSPGAGTGAHVAGEMLRSQTGIRVTHIPYRGAAPALVDLVAGQLAFVFDPLASSNPFLKDGRIRALAVATPVRSKLLPDVPTMAESGAEGVNFTAWFGLAVRNGTPAQTVSRLNRDVVEVMSANDVVKRFADLGIEISTTSPDEFAALIKRDAAAYGPAIQALQIKLD